MKFPKNLTLPILAVGGLGLAYVLFNKNTGGGNPPPTQTDPVSVIAQNRGNAPTWIADMNKVQIIAIPSGNWGVLNLRTNTDYLLQGSFFGANPAVVDLTTAGVPAYGIPGNDVPIDIYVDGVNKGDGANYSLTISSSAGGVRDWNNVTGEGTLAQLRFVKR